MPSKEGPVRFSLYSDDNGDGEMMVLETRRRKKEFTVFHTKYLEVASA